MSDDPNIGVELTQEQIGWVLAVLAILGMTAMALGLYGGRAAQPAEGGESAAREEEERKRREEEERLRREEEERLRREEEERRKTEEQRQRLRTVVAGFKAVTNAMPTENEWIDHEREALLEAIDEAGDSKALKALLGRVETLKSRVSTVEEAVGKRETRASALLKELDGLDLPKPAEMAAEERAPIEKTDRELRAAASPPPWDETALSVAEGALLDHVGAVQEAAQTIETRATRAGEIRSAASSLSVPGPDEMLPAETSRLDTIRKAIEEALATPLTAGGLKTAAEQGAALATAAQEIAKASAGRVEAAKLLTDRIAKAQIEDRFTTVEKEALGKLVTAAEGHLETPHGEGAIEEAGKAVDALEQQVAQAGIAADEREKRRQALSDRLAKVAVPADATAIERRDSLVERRRLAGLIGKAVVETDFTDLDGDIGKLEKTVGDIAALGTARKAAAAAVAAMTARFGRDSGKLDKPCHDVVFPDYTKAQTDLAAATGKSDFEAVSTLADTVKQRIVDAADYSTAKDLWYLQVQVVIDQLTDGPLDTDRTTAEGNRDTAVNEARARVAAKDFAGAKGKLAAFFAKAPADTDPEKTQFADSLHFQKKIEEYRSSAAVKAMNTAGIPYNFGTKFSEARKKGWNDLNFADAIIDIDDLISKANTWADVAALYAKCRTLDASTLTGTQPADLNAVKTGIPTGDHGNLLGKIQAIYTAHKDQAEFNKAYSKYARTAEAIIDAAGGEEKKELRKLLKEAGDKKAAGEFDEALKRVKAVSQLLKHLPGFLQAYNPLKKRMTDLDPGNVHKLLDAAETDRAAKDYKSALAKLAGVPATLDALQLYRNRRERAEKIRAALDPGATGLIQAIDTALSEAKGKAEPGGDFDGAVKRLETEFAVPAFEALSAEIAAYLEARRKAEAAHAPVRALVEHKKVVDAFDKALADAIAEAETNNDHAKATTDLAAHPATCKAVKAYAAARLRAKRAIAQVGGTDGAGGIMATVGSPANAGILDAPATWTELQKRLTAAEDKAKEGKFADARTLFDQLMTFADTAFKKAVIAIEAFDGTGSNAGHSKDRHGPEVSPALLLRRLTDGIAPEETDPPPSNPKTSKTSTSTHFKDYADWLAARELAMEEAKKVVDVSATSLQISKNPMLKCIVVTEMNKPIGDGFQGEKEKTEIDKGEPKGTKTFESYRPIDGLTRVLSNFIFMLDDPDGNGRPRDGAEFVRRWEDENPPATCSHYTGKWVLMQHYPSGDGFDPDTQSYS